MREGYNKVVNIHDVAREAAVSISTVSNVIHGRSSVNPQTAERVRTAIERLSYVRYKSSRQGPNSLGQQSLSGLKEVARRAGVSISTASRALNETSTVRQPTAERVHAAAEALDYQVNLAARNFVRDRSQMLGLLVSDIENPYFSRVARFFQDQAALHNMDTLIMNTHYDAQLTLNLIKRLVGLRVPGAAVITTEMDPLIKQTLKKNGICAVYLVNGDVGEQSSNIMIEYGQGMREAVEHLIGLGHRRIALIGGHAKFLSSEIRKQAFLECMAGFPEATAVCVDSDFTFQGGFFACRNLMSSFKPSAVIATSDLMATGAIHWAHTQGIAIPGKLSVIGFGDTSTADIVYPPLTSVGISQEKIGQEAFQALWRMIQDPSLEGQEIRVETHLVLRQSTSPVAIE